MYAQKRKPKDYKNRVGVCAFGTQTRTGPNKYARNYGLQYCDGGVNTDGRAGTRLKQEERVHHMPPSYHLVQRAQSINCAVSDGAGTNKYNITATGRPNNWSQNVKDVHVLINPDLYCRGHIIEWNLMLKYVVIKMNQLDKEAFRQRIDSNGITDLTTLGKNLKTFLKTLYNDVDNISVNEKADDNITGGVANTLRQQLEGKPEGIERTALLRKLFDAGYNPGEDEIQTIRHNYKTIFGAVYGTPTETLDIWMPTE